MPLKWDPLNEPGVGGRIDSIAVSPHESNHILVGGDILGTRVSFDQGNSWVATSGWLSYEIADFTWHPEKPEVVWAGSLSGPHISTDNGKTWEPKRTGFDFVDPARYTAPVEKILFDPDSNKIFAFGGDHRQLKKHRSKDAVLNYGSVWVSDNEGESWSLLSQIVERGNIMAVSYAGSSNHDIYAAVWKHGFFHSDDDGKTWVALNQGLPEDANGDILLSSLVVHPYDPKTAWVTVDKFGIYRTTNGGNQWQPINRGISAEGTSFWSITVAQDGKTLYAGNKNFKSRPGVYKSINQGADWQQIFCSVKQIDIQATPYPGGINPWWIEIDPASADVVYAGTDNAVYQSVDGGNVWTILTAKQTLQGWRGNGFSGLVGRNIEWNPDNLSHVIIQGMDAAKVIQSWDGGENWRIINPGLPHYKGGHDVAFASGWLFAAFGQGGQRVNDLVARSADEGRNWTMLKAPINQSEATHIHVDPANPNRLWLVVDRQLWYTDNATQTSQPHWTQLEVGESGNVIGDIEPIPNNGEAFYLATDKGIYHTTDGLNFISVDGLKDAEDVELAIAPSEPDILYAIQDRSYWDDYGVWRYNKLEDTWSRVWDDRTVTSRIGDIAVHPKDADVLAVITRDRPFHDKTWATGVWLSHDAGQTWRQENQGLPILRGDEIAFHPDGQSLIVGLGGAGFYVADFNEKREKVAFPINEFINVEEPSRRSWQQLRCIFLQSILSLIYRIKGFF